MQKMFPVKVILKRCRDMVSCFWPVVLVCAVAWLILSPIAVTALEELSLLWVGPKTATGTLVHQYEIEKTDNRDQVQPIDVGVFEFHAETGNRYTSDGEFFPGHLTKNAEIEYLESDPNVNRIKGSGCSSLFEWMWRKAFLGSIVLGVFVSFIVSVFRPLLAEYRNRLNPVVRPPFKSEY